MRSVFVALFVFVVGVTEAAAQSSHGYVFVAPGGQSAGGRTFATAHAGGGFEAILKRYVGVGADLGYVAPTERLGSGVGVVSPNGYFHIGGDHYRGIDPFVTAGYTAFIRTRTRSLFNFGGGMNWWITDGKGLKFEFRDHVDAGGATTIHFWSIRLGLTFR